MSGMLLGALPMIVTGQPATPVPAKTGYVIVSLPPMVSGPRLDEVVRLTAAAQIAADPSPSPAPWKVEAAPVDEADDLAASVVVAHEERIAVLKRHLAAARDRRSTAPQVADLRARLRRAEAARGLAMRRLEFAGQQAFAAHRDGLAAATLRASSTAASMQTAVVLDGVGDRAESAAYRLAQARQSLGKARAILTAEGRAPVALAGLMTWEGSDRWSLADVRTA